MRVGIIFGGRSGEHEVSLASARSVMGALDRERYEIVPIGITRAGRWIHSERSLEMLKAAVGSLTTADEVEAALNAVGRPFPDLAALAELDVVFPVLHGPYGEDGTIQGLLELIGVPYVGCGVASSAVGMDKALMKELFIARELPVVRYRVVLRRRWEAEPESVVREMEATLPYPMFVKPANLGSSVGVTKAHNRDELIAGLTEAARYDRKLLVEEGVDGAREIECSVLGNDEPQASIPGEVVPSHEFYDYAAKYLNGTSQLLIPAPLSPDQTRQVQELAIAAFRAVDGAGMARVDFLLSRDDGRIYVNEVNTIPGFTNISMYPKLWEASGLPYPALVDRLIELAFERHAERSRCENVPTLSYQGYEQAS
ncbi:MAG: D-alanine--D-alanine ligase [Anaerolineae bacterium]|nr:D-alanine--D-alanine ligase [Anaerolineae bacterium]